MSSPPAAGPAHIQLSYQPLPRGTSTVAVLTLADPAGTRSGNTLGPATLASLEAALDETLSSPAAALCVTGTGPLFSAGADPGLLSAQLARAGQLAISAEGQRVFGRLLDAEIPTFALVNGPALGGGAELALHCRYRVMSSRSCLALPECEIGLVPGWGGTQRLPRLAGPGPAVDLAVVRPVTGAGPMPAVTAHQAGLADVVLPWRGFHPGALDWVAAVLAGAAAGRPPARPDSRTWSAAVSRGQAAIARSRHRAAAAPWRLLDLLAAARHLPLPDGLAAERTALADLAGADQYRSLIYLHEARRAVRETRRTRQAGLPAGPGRIAVCGPGRLAARLARCLAARLPAAVMVAGFPQPGGRASGRPTADQRGVIEHVPLQQALSAAGLVFLVSADRDPAAERRWLAELDGRLSQRSTLVCTSAWYPVGLLAAGLRHPERLIRGRVFAADGRPALIEASGAPATGQHAWDAVGRLGAALGVPCLPVGDGPGFLLYRLLARFLAELALVGGHDARPLPSPWPAALRALGLPSSAMALLPGLTPTAGNRLASYLSTRFPDRFGPFPVLSGSAAPLPPHRLPGHRLPGHRLPGHRLPRHCPPPGFRSDPVLAPAFRGLAEEIGLVLGEGLVTDARLIDVALADGAGWPAHLGGIVPYLRRTGACAAAGWDTPASAMGCRESTGMPDDDL